MTYKRILVPVDGSPTSNAGLREAVKLARTQHATLLLLHVLDEFVAFSTPGGGINAGAIVDALKKGGERVLKKAQRLAKGVKTESVLVESLGSRVADIIAQQAKRWRADLIVMGTHGRRGVERLLLGSDAEIVARGAPAPLLLVRHSGAKKSPGRRARK